MILREIRGDNGRYLQSERIMLVSQRSQGGVVILATRLQGHGLIGAEVDITCSEHVQPILSLRENLKVPVLDQCVWRFLAYNECLLLGFGRKVHEIGDAIKCPKIMAIRAAVHEKAVALVEAQEAV